jgi:flagellar motor switch protein FliN
MSDMQHLADVMFASAATVLGRLAEQTATANPSQPGDGSTALTLDASRLVALAELPALSCRIVVRFPAAEMQQVVGIMLGSDDGGEMGEMQHAIASETVSQIAINMVDALASELQLSPEGISAAICTDAALLPPPPFESYEGTILIGANLAPRVSVDFASLTAVESQSKASEAVAAASAVTASAAAAAPASAQSVTYTPMQPTPVPVTAPGQANLDLVHDVALQVSAVLGKTVMPLREVVSLQSGSVFELDKLAAEPIDLYVNNILIARGEVVVVDDKYAVKISELNPQG